MRQAIVNVRFLLLTAVSILLLNQLGCNALPIPADETPALSSTTAPTAAVIDMEAALEEQAGEMQPLAGHQSHDKDEPSAPEGAQHTADAIVEPLTKLAHVTYDSVPVTHKPNDHMPLFHREGHDELNKA